MVIDANTKYSLLLQINNAIITKKTRSGLFKTLASEISKIFHYDRFSILLYDSQTQSLNYFAAADGIRPAEISKNNRPLTQGAIASAVIRSRKPLIIDDLSSHIYWESIQALKNAGLNATMAFPLIVRDQVLGIINFSFAKAPSNMHDLVDFLNELSNQVAIAVDSIMTYVNLKAYNEQLKRQKDFLQFTDDDHSGVGEIYYASRSMRELMREAETLSGSDVPVLLTGETGTGKDLIARYIHRLSHRREGLFVKVNCPALPSTLFESELFGHAKGAFTGANEKRIGRFEMAHGGTVFLDEIGELNSSLQAKFLHVVQDKAFERVGESRTVKFDFRVISATNKDLNASINDETFRSDLFFRLNTVSLHVPPLKERPEDIPLLAERLAGKHARKMNRSVPIFSDSCLKLMVRYSWPGNVRELENLVNRFVTMRPGETITGRDIESLITEVHHDSNNTYLTLAEIERRHIARALAKTGGVVSGPYGAATLLGIPRQTLQYRMKKYGLKPTNHRKESVSPS